MGVKVKLVILLMAAVGLQSCTVFRAAGSVRQDRLEQSLRKKCLTRRDFVKTVGKPEKIIRHSDGAGRVDMHTVSIRSEDTPGAAFSLGMSIMSLGLTELSVGAMDGVNAIDDKDSCNPTLGAACEYRKERWYVHYGPESNAPICMDRVVLRKGAFKNSDRLFSSCPYMYKRNLAERLPETAFVDMAEDGESVRDRMGTGAGKGEESLSDAQWRKLLIEITAHDPCGTEG